MDTGTTSERTASRPRRTQEERRAHTEAALLAAAADLVVEAGVSALTLARVGERAGYSRGIVTHHFGSKQALLEALARSAQAGFVAGLEDVPAGLEHLLRLVAGYVRALAGAGVASRAFLLLWATAPTSPELAPIFAERDERFRADLHADVAQGVADGAVRADVDPHAVAVAVLGQLRGISMQHQLAPESVDTELLGALVADTWRRALETV
ncbi:TetR/AcrR family transcriptional regulator [Actinomycetospora sp. CA-101289]|uniref:TetR/AcrR family transcriptional regulator n=1 Tax=Actinomycetospora sp. CA-101289 TaxID=3239893 RepID=UPI003D99D48D